MTIRSVGGTSLIKARSKVVLPEPVPPAITKFRLARTAAARKSCNSSVSRPRNCNSPRLEISKRCRRIIKLGRSETSIVAKSREPSGNCIFSSGVPASNLRSWRERRVAARRTSSINSSSVSTIGSRVSRTPLRSFTHTDELPRT